MPIGELAELHYITPTANLESILKLGILSNHRAKEVKHESVALQDVQETRETLKIPGGLPLHDYVNLYLNARNPMMYRRRELHEKLAVVRVSPKVLDVEGVVIADGNAASRDWTSFRPSRDGLKRIDYETVFSEYWTDDDPIEYARKKRIMCAEALIPHIVQSEYIMGVYTSAQATMVAIQAVLPQLDCTVYPWMFFRGPRRQGGPR